jgi:hypothetical protein
MLQTSSHYLVSFFRKCHSQRIKHFGNKFHVFFKLPINSSIRSQLLRTQRQYIMRIFNSDIFKSKLKYWSHILPQEGSGFGSQTVPSKNKPPLSFNFSLIVWWLNFFSGTLFYLFIHSYYASSSFLSILTFLSPSILLSSSKLLFFNWFLMTPSIATKPQYVNFPFLFSFSLTTCFGPYGPSSGEINN